MRLFVALELPAEQRRLVHERAAQVASRVPAARWVAAANLHLTLAFLGDTERSLLDALGTALRQAFGAVSRFEAWLGEPGWFPPRRPPRVLWVGLGPRQELTELQRRVARAVASTLEAAEDRKVFHPHVTVARCRDGWDRTAAEAWMAGFGALACASFPVEEGALIESRLGAGGARYRTLERFALKAAA